MVYVVGHVRRGDFNQHIVPYHTGEGGRGNGQVERGLGRAGSVITHHSPSILSCLQNENDTPA